MLFTCVAKYTIPQSACAKIKQYENIKNKMLS